MELNRRDFLKGAGTTALIAGGAALLGACTNDAVADNTAVAATEASLAVNRPAVELSGVSELTGWAGTPEHIAALGGSTMPLVDLNRYRKQYLDSQTDYTCADGTVIPAVYVKLRALIHTYGMGCGNTPHDGSFEDMMRYFSEDDAQAFLDMPWGEKFTAIDLYDKGGRSYEECADICERAAQAGYLIRFDTNSGLSYHQVPYFQGVVEYHFKDAISQPGYNIGVTGIDWLPDDMRSTGTPTFYAMPCDKSVVSDGVVLPFDDVDAIIKTKNKLAIAPCYCRYLAATGSGIEGVPTFEDFATGKFEEYFSPVVDQRLETCLMMGDEAQYWVEMGIAREITQEDALRYMQRSRDDGFILQSCFSKDSGTICSCHSASCGILMEWSTLGGPAEIGSSKPYESISHYNLAVDLDSCIKCGRCSVRCPLHAISMDKETGFPVVNEMCFRCGQCAFVCPQKARKLEKRPDEEILELPRDFLDDDNMKAAYRFEHGLIV